MAVAPLYVAVSIDWAGNMCWAVVRINYVEIVGSCVSMLLAGDN